MENELRKVIFTLNEQGFSLGDLGCEDTKGTLDERRGYFHRWGDIVQYDATLERNVQKTIAIVEDETTGLVSEVAPHCVKFQNWRTKCKY